MIKKLIPYLFSVLILLSMIAIAGKSNSPALIPDKNTEDIKPETNVEMRGVWVTYMALDVENYSDKEKAFSDKIDGIIADMKSGDFNNMIVQVRPFCDAIYRSSFFPWSHIISGTQGVDPGFDPLKIICDKCRENNINIHAWINPYRVSTQNTPAELSVGNPYLTDSDIGVEINNSRYLNPASEKARELIVNGIIELLERYDIDGIQFDDYFYPEDCGDFDKEDYEAYKRSASSPLSLEEFRKSNVNKLIKAVCQAVHNTERNAVFGISPQGNLPNNDALYADVRLWCEEEGYIDYICPQIYFSLDNPALTFEDGLEQWLKLKTHKNLKLYAGLAAYKAGTDADSGTWLDNSDVLATEIQILREKGADGFMLYSSDSFHNEQNSEEIRNVINYITNSPSQ